jgi:hypothetical protein
VVGEDSPRRRGDRVRRPVPSRSGKLWNALNGCRKVKTEPA